MFHQHNYAFYLWGSSSKTDLENAVKCKAYLDNLDTMCLYAGVVYTLYDSSNVFNGDGTPQNCEKDPIRVRQQTNNINGTEIDFHIDKHGNCWPCIDTDLSSENTHATDCLSCSNYFFNQGGGTSYVVKESKMVEVDVPVGKTATEVSVGASHACVQLSDENLYCWGDGFTDFGHEAVNTSCIAKCAADTGCEGYSLEFGPASFGPQKSIFTKAYSANSVYAADLDNDGDMDVLSASYADSKIAWYENTDGQGTFSTRKTITTQASFAWSVYAADLDNDGDMDVLSASYTDDKIAWYENYGNKTFSTQKTITTQADGAYSVYAADIDNDGDMDVLSASYSDDKIAWYENTDGQGTFSTQKTITTQADSASSVYAADIDNDGDMDVLSASYSDDKIAWYENNGDKTFSTQKTITTQADSALSVYAADIDGDGDMDVLSASARDDKIAWYENYGDKTFNTQKTITTQADGAHYVYAADIDNDGDMDVLSASASDDKIAWYENTDGQGTFSTQKTYHTSRRSKVCLCS